MTTPSASNSEPEPVPAGLESEGTKLDAGSSLLGETHIFSKPLDDVMQTDLGIPFHFGRYRIERELGRGGMGVVYLARDQQLERKVALKIPFFSREDDAEAVERFYREARSMAALHHANLCPVFDVGRFEQWHFLTMAFIDGHSLLYQIKAHGVMSVTESLTLLKSVALALQKAHDAGVVHRDLKPANIMLTREREPVIMDFGLARHRKSGEADLTRSGAVLGSPAYMAPEQVEARHDEIGPATDVYALGLILYQMLTNTRPFEGSVASIFGQIVSREPSPPSQIRPELSAIIDAICLKALAKSPSHRHASASEFATDLDRALQQPSGQTSAPQVVATRDVTINTESDSSEIKASKTMAAASTTGTQRSFREAELRQVTVAVFAFEPDDDDSSEASQSASFSEIQHGRAQEFAKLVGEQVAKFGGVTVSGASEDVVACFGFPNAFEDAAQRAVRAALAVMHELKAQDGDVGRALLPVSSNEQGRRAGVPILQRPTLPSAEKARVTIHAGEAVAEFASAGADGAISLVGDARNVAGRLSAVVEPGLIVVSPAAHQRVQLFFQCESLGTQRVRGMSQPVELFKVLKEAASRNRVELVDPGNLTPLVGRDTELTILKDRWEQALDELGQIVLLVGDAGLGKSRLIRELREHVIREDSEGAAVIELRCSQYHQNAPYFPLVEFLSQLLRFEHHSNAERLDIVVRYLSELKMETADNVALFCKMLGIAADSRYPALNLPPAKLKERTEELLLLWLKQLIAVSPVLFIVEDLHWVDPSTVGLVERHVEQFEIDRALTLLTFRPEFEPPWKAKPHTTHIALNRLTKRQIGEMMRKRTKRKEIPDAILQQVIERTDGIPLFIEEFSAMIVESNILDRADAGVEASSLLNVIPATLHDLLLARLDRMDANREVIQFAATIGREFTHELLAAVCSLTAADLDAELDKLVKAEILFQKGTGSAASYIFKHALLQDAAYRSMLTKKRQSCHQRIAEVLEAQFAEIASSQPALLAQHFGEAALTDKAIEYWLKAGQRSAAASAVPEAIQQFHRGLDLVRSLPESIHRDELELQYQMPLGGVLVQAKGYGASEPGQVFTHAREICEKLGRRQELGLVLAGMWGWTLVRAEYPEALRLAEAQVRLGDELNDPGLQGEACWAMTCTLFYMGRFAEAAAQARKGIAIHDEHMDCWRPFAAVAGQSAAVCERAYLALSLFCLGELEDAISYSEAAVLLARSTKDPFSLSMALYHGAWLRLWAGRVDELKALSEEGLKLCQDLSFHFYAVTQQFNVAAVPLLSDNATPQQLETFVTTIRTALTAHLGAGSGVFLSKMYWLLADALRRLGRLDDAQVELTNGFNHQDRSGERFCDAELHRLQSQLHQARGDSGAASSSLTTAINIATAQSAKEWLSRCNAGA